MFSSEVEILYRNNGFEFFGHKENKSINSKIFVSSESDLYFPIMKVYITTHLKTENNKALSNFYKEIDYK